MASDIYCLIGDSLFSSIKSKLSRGDSIFSARLITISGFLSIGILCNPGFVIRLSC